jgi:hypothetical protein
MLHFPVSLLMLVSLGVCKVRVLDLLGPKTLNQRKTLNLVGLGWAL